MKVKTSNQLIEFWLVKKLKQEIETLFKGLESKDSIPLFQKIEQVLQQCKKIEEKTNV